MRRRYVIRGGAVLGLGSLAGCIVDDIGDIAGGSDATTPTEPEDESGSGPEDDSDPEPSDGSDEGEVSFTVEPSASEIEWGEPYSVSVTVSAEDTSDVVGTGVSWKKGSASSWSGPLRDTVKQWDIGAGESQTEKFDIKFGSAGEYTLGLTRVESGYTIESVIEEWELTVQEPRAALGEPISYYDGLDMTVDAEIHESMDFELEYGEINDEETGTFSVSVRDGKWVKVNIAAENTNEEGEVTLPRDSQFSGLAGGTGLDSGKPVSYGVDVGEGTIYEIDDPPNDVGDGPRLYMEKDGNIRQDGYWYKPGEIVAGAKEEGWIVFAVEEEDITVDDLEVRLDRQGLDVRAEWTNE